MTDAELREIRKYAEQQYRIFGGTRRRVSKELAKDYALILDLVDEVRRLQAKLEAAQSPRPVDSGEQ